MLACNVSQDGVALGNLSVTINKIGELERKEKKKSKDAKIL